MATQSILKNIVIHDESSASALVEALEKAASKKPTNSPDYTVKELQRTKKHLEEN